MKKANIIHILLVLNFLFLTAACSQLEPYRVMTDEPPGKDGVLPEQPVYRADVSILPDKKPLSRVCDNSKTNCIQIVEFDEFGNAQSRKQLETSISESKKVAEAGGTVLVYVHGWHHSAKPGDKDIEAFLDSVTYASNSNSKPAMGIYIAWRGDSIPSDNWFTSPFSYMLTFWDRKSTAHSVGSGGGVSELLRKVSDVRKNTSSRLVIIGHSFGGAILYSSVSQLMAEQIRLDMRCIRGKDGQPENGIAEFNEIADLVVLVNPAFEAMQMSPLYALARDATYKCNLPPRIVVVTTEADWAL